MKPTAALIDDPAGVSTGAVISDKLAGWLCDTPEYLEESVERAVRAKVLAIDTETLGFNQYVLKRKGVFGISFAWRDPDGSLHARYVPMRHSYPDAPNLKLTFDVKRSLRSLIGRPGPLRCGHNFRFDAGFLVADEAVGCLPVRPVEDTQWLAWLENEERGFGQYKLKVLGQTFVEAEAKSLADDLAELRKVIPGALDNWSLLPIDEVGPYAAQDARLTLLLWEALDAALKEQDAKAKAEGWQHKPLEQVRLLEREATIRYWEMERRGLGVDYEYALDCVSRVQRGRELAADKMMEVVTQVTGASPETCEPSKYRWVAAQLLRLGYDPKPEDLDRTGVPKTNSQAIARNGFNSHPFVKALYRWRAYNNADKKYFGPIVHRSTPDPMGTGISVVHAEFYQTRARSGRVQASEPNLMNIPLYKVGMSRAMIMNNLRAGESKAAVHGVTSEEDHEGLLLADEANVRRALRARPGYTLVFADYAQQELRAFVEISQEPTLLQLLESGADLHYETACAVMTMPKKEEVADEDSYKKIVAQGRSVGKMLNFGMIFGMGVNRYYDTAGYDQLVEAEVAEFEAKLGTIGVSADTAPIEQVTAALNQYRAQRRAHYRQRAEQEVEGYHAKYPRVRKFHQKIVNIAKKRGYITNQYGRRRRLPWNGPVTQYFNFIIQGSCADMMRTGMTQLASACEESKIRAFPVLTIHDEIIFECWTPHLKQFVAKVRAILPRPEGWRLEFPVDVKMSDGTFEQKRLYKEETE